MSAGAPAAGALLARAGAEHRAGRLGAARRLIDEALAAAPRFGEAWRALGTVHADEGRFAEAVAALDVALDCGVGRPHEAHLQRAVWFADHLRRDDDARAALEAALALKPDYLPALMNLGNLHEQRGDRDAALACYARALDEPRFAAVPESALRHVALARTAVMRPPASIDDPLVARLRAAIDATPPDALERVHLQFALGQGLDRLGAVDAAFDAFARGNRTLLRREGRRYDPRREAAAVDALMAAFPPAAAASSNDDRPDVDRDARPAPVFICGMFRSGSTLLEQVLAGHPEVVAGGEIDWLPRLAFERLAPFPARAIGLSRDEAARLGAEYRAHVAALFPASVDARVLTDKRPDNHLLVGLIKRLFPRAKVLHTVRHPMDNGLSVYMQHMNLEVTPYANDLGDIGHYYGQYRRLMAHWDACFPGDLHVVPYESLVHDAEATVRGVLAFLGLAWDARCLAFHERRNTVKTASYWQVRRPLYGDAAGRWRRYRAHLASLEAALRTAGVDVPDAD
jgi:tetratricopeptide (TPR) repeat protein